MKKKILIATLASFMTLAISVPSFALGWTKGSTKNAWWYDLGNGQYHKGWQWIDGNNDGIAESYCFDLNGWLYQNTITPDGYTVNADGAWVDNGVVQRKKVEVKRNEKSILGEYFRNVGESPEYAGSIIDIKQVGNGGYIAQVSGYSGMNTGGLDDYYNVQRKDGHYYIYDTDGSVFFRFTFDGQNTIKIDYQGSNVSGGLGVDEFRGTYIRRK